MIAKYLSVEFNQPIAVQPNYVSDATVGRALTPGGAVVESIGFCGGAYEVVAGDVVYEIPSHNVRCARRMKG